MDKVHIQYLFGPRISIPVWVLSETRSGTQSAWNDLCILGMFGYFIYVFGITDIFKFLVQVFGYSLGLWVKFQS